MAEEASVTEVVAAAHWKGLQHFLCPSASVVAAEPLHTDPVSLIAPSW